MLTIKTKCNTCGEELLIQQIVEDSGNITLHICPCVNCGKYYDIGWKDGHCKGYNEGLIAGQTE